MADWCLDLGEEARLLYRGRPVAVRRRGLAILVLIALESPAARARLAGMLWSHGQGLNNLRVELHALRRHFPGWARGADPLSLPPGLEVRVGKAPRLSNLRGISPALDAWLERLWGPGPVRLLSRGLEGLRPPFVLFLRCFPLTDSEGLLREITAVAGLGGRRGIGVVRVEQELDPRVVLAAPEKSWVVFLPPYGEDSVALLELRAHLPADRVRYLELAPLGWREARERWLKTLPFLEAARVFLEAGGQPGHIAELLALRPAQGFGEQLPLPQRVRAVYRRESRFLSQAARFALERLSVHPGLLPVALISAMDLEEEVEELERKRWLVFQDEGWVFRHESGRRVLAAGMEEGRRRLYHRRLARVFRNLGEVLAAVYHLRQAGIAAALPDSLPPWARWVLGEEGRPWRPEEADAGGELLIEGFEPDTEDVEVRGDRIAFVRTPAASRPSTVAFNSPELPSLLRLRGRAWVENPLGIGLNGEAQPLFLEAQGRRIVLAPVTEPQEAASGIRLLPLGEAFEHWIGLPPGVPVRLGSAAANAVIELELAFFRILRAGGRRVRAFPLAPAA